MRHAAWLIALLIAVGGIRADDTSAHQSPEISPEVRAHLDEIVEVLKARWLRRGSMDWVSFRQRVLAKAAGARTLPDSDEAIRLALQRLGDRHSDYIPAQGSVIFNPESPSQSTGQCTPVDAVTPPLPPDIGFVKGQISTGQAGADQIQQSIRGRDAVKTRAWIVDVRNSRGGNMWPAIAALGPILGEGTAGYFADADGALQPWGYTDGAAWLDAQTVALLQPSYKTISPHPPVAVLTDIGVVSSGEGVAIAFRGRPKTRSFGADLRPVDRRQSNAACHRRPARSGDRGHGRSRQAPLRRRSQSRRARDGPRAGCAPRVRVACSSDSLDRTRLTPAQLARSCRA
jgi:carboxyl-terminal processing protease